MKIIHCADLHLDSKMTSNLSKEQAKERKMEILRTYSRMIEYAKNNDVKAIIIAGDLFDTRNVSATARNLVKDSITSNPDIDFYYLKGNHDSDNFISKLDEIPENLKLFSNQWTSYSYGNITITGLEIDKSNQASMTILLCSTMTITTLSLSTDSSVMRFPQATLRIRALIISHSVMCMSIRADSLTTVACTATAAA